MARDSGGPPVTPSELLSLYDREMRRAPPADPWTRVETLPHVARMIGPPNCIVWSELDSDSADQVIAGPRADFAAMKADVEWKVYSHDLPHDLSERLRAAGFAPDPPETLMVWDLARPFPDRPAPSNVDIRQELDGPSLREAVGVSEEAFGKGEGWIRGDWESRLVDPSFAVYVAYRDGSPVASGRLEMPEGRSFASLWGGGTDPRHRGLGIYRELVAKRGELAKARGYRFLTVDARESSRPILERAGFVPLDSIRGWVWRFSDTERITP